MGTTSNPKTNMEPERHLFEKESHLPKPSFLDSMIVFWGAYPP